MILYFDSFITEIPWPGRGRDSLKEDIRKNCVAYKMPTKIDVAKYSLASYGLYPWSNVLIRYELDDTGQTREFDKFILKLFPKAIILHERSDSQQDYKKSFEILAKMKDDWIFYAPNNDNPLITSDKNFINYISKLIKKAEGFRKKYNYTSIVYSHFTEYINLPVKDTPINVMLGKGIKIIEDDDIAISYIVPNGFFGSIQIVNKDLFQKSFIEPKLSNRRVVRAEDVDGIVKINKHLVIAPKKEICAHFDNYDFTVGSPNEIQNDKIPPLFIPEGFFDNSIKIAYGYKQYRKGWVNINPKAKKYSFRDNKHGTDLKISLDDIPLFWKSRIKTIDVNKRADIEKLKQYAENNKETLINPWKNLELNMWTIRFYLRLYLYKFLLAIGLVNIIRPIQSKHKALYFFLRNISI